MSSSQQKIGIVVNKHKAGALELLGKLQQWLSKRDFEAVDSTSQPIESIIEQSGLVICLGGDGTLLSVASQMKEKSVPILGVNLGSLGFLTEVKGDEVFEELNAFFLGQSQIENRLMLACSAQSASEKRERRFCALNDMVISREGLTRLLRLEVSVSGELMSSFSGDGVIVATPTGSTAYSLSAGGAIVHPRLDALVITPICPHSLSLRSVIVSAEEKITVKISADRPGEKALLTADGQENLEIDDSFTVDIMRSNNPVQLVKSSKRSYLGTLKEKFKFPG